MESPQTIQKTFRVFRSLTKIAMLMSLAGAGLAALCGITVGAPWALTGTGGPRL